MENKGGPAGNPGGSYNLYLVRQYGIGRRTSSLELVLILAPLFTYQCSLGKLQTALS